MMMVGLDFDMQSLTQSEGTYALPLTQYGGAFGTTPEHNLMKEGGEDENIIFITNASQIMDI